MAKTLEGADRLVKLQDKIARHSKFEQLRCQAELNTLDEKIHAVVEVLDRGGISWALFPEMSNRNLSNLGDAKKAMSAAVQQAAEVALGESKRLESLTKQYNLLLRDDERRRDNEIRLETLSGSSSSSVSRKFDALTISERKS